jgi:hypothetical protein
MEENSSQDANKEKNIALEETVKENTSYEEQPEEETTGKVNHEEVPSEGETMETLDETDDEHSIDTLEPTEASPARRRPAWLRGITREEHLEEDMEEFDYDQLFKDIEADEGSNNRLPRPAAMVHSVLKQLAQTMSLSRVRLPACVLECRSLLECYSAAFVRPDLLAAVPQGASPRHRLERTAAFYLSQLAGMRPTDAALKPYNPCLGEVFMCEWTSPAAPDHTVAFLAEQVSHHPAVSAIYAECAAAGVTYSGTIATVSGLKCRLLVWPHVMTVASQGVAHLLLHRLGERYSFTFPAGEARDLLGEPWFQLAGSSRLTSDTHGTAVEFEFSDRDRVSGRLLDPRGCTVARLGGSWRGRVELWEGEAGPRRLLIDLKAREGPAAARLVAPMARQAGFESRRLWRRLTRALVHSPELADEEKRKVEEAARRAEEVRPRFFDLSQSPVDHALLATFRFATFGHYQT